MKNIVNLALIQKKKKKIHNIFHNSWVGKLLLVFI